MKIKSLESVPIDHEEGELDESPPAKVYSWIIKNII
jgi:hypothetical protein